MSTKANSKKASTKKTSTSTTASKKQKKAAEPVQQPEESVERKERKRRDVNKETIDLDFTALQQRIESEISRLRESSEKVRGIKFLRSINKALKSLHSDTKRVVKLKKKNNRKKSTVINGFLKPIRISQELANFCGWDVNQTYSRVNVTKFICNYVQKNHLYNQQNKQFILCDDKLKKLLNNDPANPGVDKNGKQTPLNYPLLQRYLKPHFIKIEEPVAASTPAATTTESSSSSSSSAPTTSRKTTVSSKKPRKQQEEDAE